jgi:uncharacterized protein (TIGR02996 family)
MVQLLESDEEFVRALAASPGDVAVSLIYADWLEERRDRKGPFIRLWAELWLSEYREGTFEQIHTLAEQYRKAAETLDRQWLVRVGRASGSIANWRSLSCGSICGCDTAAKRIANGLGFGAITPVRLGRCISGDKTQPSLSPAQ